MTEFARGRRCLATSTTGAVILLLSLALATAARAESPSDATGRFLQEGANVESDSIADDILDGIKSGDVPKGTSRDAIKTYVKGKIKDGLKQDVQSEGMQAILGSIADELKKERGKPCQQAAMRAAYGNVSDPSSRRVIKGAGNTFVDIGFDVMTGGAGKAKKLAELSLAKLGKKLAKNVLKEIDKRIEEELAKSAGAFEVYRATGDRYGCDVSIAVFWNKVKGSFRFMIAGDCKCKEVRGVSLGRWSVTGSGGASFKKGKAGTPFVRHTKGVNKVFVVKAVCCSSGVENGSSIDPWKTSYAVGSPTPPASGVPMEDKPKPAVADPGPPYFVKILKVPAGPVCPKVKAQLLKDAEAIQGNAERNRSAARNELGAVMGGVGKKPPTHTQAQLDAANEKLRKARLDNDAAGRAVRAIYDLKVKPQSECDKHSSLLGTPGLDYAGVPVEDPAPTAAALRDMRESLIDDSQAVIYVPSGFDPALASHRALVRDVGDAAIAAQPVEEPDNRATDGMNESRRNAAPGNDRPADSARNTPSERQPIAAGGAPIRVDAGPRSADFRTSAQRNVPLAPRSEFPVE